MKTYQSFSSKETRELGMRLAKELSVKLAKESNRRRGRAGAVVFALEGELGAGKTTFVQGFFKGLGLKKRVPSPTFIIMRRYALGGAARPRRRDRPHARAADRRQQFTSVFHVDAYRLKDVRALLALDFENILTDPRNIVLIEWADRVNNILPKGARWIVFHHGKKENERCVMIKQ